MSQNERETAAPDGFQQKLNELRWRIDLLPQQQRSHLDKLANVAEQQNERKPDSADGGREMMDDLRLLEKHVRREAKAARRQVRSARRRRSPGS
jgi:hypothetical protein